MTLAVAVFLATGPAGAAAETGVEANLKVVGRSDLGLSGASYGDVAVVGTTAVVATRTAGPAGCPTASAVVIDLKDPRRPRVVATIPVPAGLTVSDVDAVDVATAAFTGDLVALALTPLPGACGDSAAATVGYHDLSDPSQPKPLSQSAGCPACDRATQSVSLAQRDDGRILAARTNLDPPGIAVDDLSDPRRPVVLAHWAAPLQACGTAGVVLHDSGTDALITLPGGAIDDLSLSEPSRPADAGGPAPAPDAAGRPAGAAVVLLANRTVAIVAEEGACSSAASPARGLRVLSLMKGAPPHEESPVRFPSPNPPGRLVASGALAYVAWHGDGLRVLDFGEVRPRTVAQFVPPGPADVVGVALLPAHVVVADATSGVYVLQRPEEGGGRAAFWSQLLSLLQFVGPAMLVAAAFAVLPRLTLGRAGAASRVTTPSRVRRRA